MILPIAIVYDKYGKLSHAKCLKFASNDNIDFNTVNTYQVNEYTLDNAKVIDMPISSVGKIVNCAVTFPQVRDLTRLDANNRPLDTQYTQIIFTKQQKEGTIHICNDKRAYVYAVDYTGKAFILTNQQLLNMLFTHGIHLGNLATAESTIFKSVDRDFWGKYSLFSAKASIYARTLDEQSTLMLKPMYTSSNVDITLIPEGTNALRIPKGALDAALLNRPNLRAIKSVFFPEVMLDARVILEDSDLDTVQYPRYIFNKFSLNAHSVKNMILPEYILTTSVGAAISLLKLGVTDLEHLKMPLSLVSKSMIEIGNAPNLRTISHTLISVDAFTEVLYTIKLDNCPRFESLNLYTSEPSSVDATYLELNLYFGRLPEYTLNLYTPVRALSLTVHNREHNSVIHINHTGIGKITVLNAGKLLPTAEIFIDRQVRGYGYSQSGNKFTIKTETKSYDTTLILNKGGIQYDTAHSLDI